VLHSRRVERRPPAALVVLRELEVVALVRHADGDVADVSPGVEPGAERVERAIVRVHRAPSEADRSTQKLATLVEHVGSYSGDSVTSTSPVPSATFPR